MRDISKELEQYRKARKDRIMRRVNMYIDGEFSLDDFYRLERLDVIEDRIQESTKATAAELLDIYEAAGQEQEQSQTVLTEAAQPAQQELKYNPPTIDVSILEGMTKEEFRQLTLTEMNYLYNAAPDKVHEILGKRPAYMDIIDPRPQPRDYTGTTPEEFNKMSFAELQELAAADRSLYDRLRAEANELQQERVARNRERNLNALRNSYGFTDPPTGKPKGKRKK